MIDFQNFRTYFGVWLAFAGATPVLTVLYNQLWQPTDPVYPLSILYPPAQNNSTTAEAPSPPYLAVLASAVVQLLASLHAFFAVLVSDLLPLCLAIGYRYEKK